MFRFARSHLGQMENCMQEFALSFLVFILSLSLSLVRLAKQCKSVLCKDNRAVVSNGEINTRFCNAKRWRAPPLRDFASALEFASANPAFNPRPVSVAKRIFDAMRLIITRRTSRENNSRVSC